MYQMSNAKDNTEIIEEEEMSDDDEELMDIDDGSNTIVDDMGNMMAQIFLTPEGESVGSVLKQIATNLETQNKILVKIASNLLKK